VKQPRIDQFIPVLDPSDAASNHTLLVRQLLRQAGWASDIFTEQTHPSLADQTRPYEEHDRRSPVLYQFAIGSRMADWLLSQTMPVAVNHHNVTPARFFEAWDPGLVHGTSWGQHQLHQLSSRADFAVAVSAYNAAEVTSAGFRTVRVSPLLLDPDALRGAVDDAEVEALRHKDGAAWVFVGRIVPNKAQHHLIAALAVYRQCFDPQARLWIVGGSSSTTYEAALRRYASALGLGDAVEFTGRIDDRARSARLRAADVLVCASEHEGFCVPLLEAMAADVPVVAVDAGAVAETVGSAGLVIPEPTPTVLATAVHAIVSDGRRRQLLIDAGRRRLADFAPSITGPAMLRAMLPWTAP
jgi:glycosyltransferase involved in cell wall biosynthesis